MGYRVLSGTGEELGHVLGVENDRDGRPKKLCFVEHDGDEPRFVPLRFVRDIQQGVIRLAGPREGYHITRVRHPGGAVSRVMADPADEDEDATWAGS